LKGRGERNRIPPTYRPVNAAENAGDPTQKKNRGKKTPSGLTKDKQKQNDRKKRERWATKERWSPQKKNRSGSPKVTACMLGEGERQRKCFTAFVICSTATGRRQTNANGSRLDCKGEVRRQPPLFHGCFEGDPCYTKQKKTKKRTKKKIECATGLRGPNPKGNRGGQTWKKKNQSLCGGSKKKAPLGEVSNRRWARITRDRPPKSLSKKKKTHENPVNLQRKEAPEQRSLWGGLPDWKKRGTCVSTMIFKIREIKGGRKTCDRLGRNPDPVTWWN